MFGTLLNIVKSVRWYYKERVCKHGLSFPLGTCVFSAELTSVQMSADDRCFEWQGHVRPRISLCRGPVAGGSRLRHVTERSPMCLLNKEKGEAESKAEMMGKAWKSGQTLIKSVPCLRAIEQLVSFKQVGQVSTVRRQWCGWCREFRLLQESMIIKATIRTIRLIIVHLWIDS